MPAIAGLVLASLCGGCSFLFVHGPPANHKQLAYFDCSTSNALPVIDTIFGAGTALGVVGVASDGAAFSDLGSKKAAIATYAVEAAIFGGSAVYGFKKTSDCRAAQAEMMARMPVAPFAPAPGFRPPPAVDPWTGRPVAPPPP